jgi:hypothetical protein
MPKIAGIESTAKIKSVNSTTIKTSSKQRSHPLSVSDGTKNFSPSYSFRNRNKSRQTETMLAVFDVEFVVVAA